MAVIVAIREPTWFARKFDESLWHHAVGPYNPELHLLDNFDNLPNGTLVALVESGDILLRDFEHPEDAVYIFGKTGQSDHEIPGELRVRIDTPNKISFFGHVAAAIVLSDRYTKWQSQ